MTPTASGKTLCYALPDPAGASPTTRPRGRSSCSRPRRSARTRWPSSASWRRRPACRSRRRPTTATRRRRSGRPIRAAGQVVVTNPDMLHSAILPHHTKWFQLFEQLQLIVIDELHTYRGVFGSHVANVLRRLLRICAHYGSHPVIVCCSATIGNPGELAAMLTGRPARLVDRNGAPAGERHVVLVDPPVLDPASGARGSAVDPRPALGAAVPARRAPDDRVRPVAGRGRAAADRPARVAARELRAAQPGPRLPRRLPADRAPGDRARACATARSSASSPPTRSSSASTSAGSTCRSWPATRARSPATWQQFGRAGRRPGHERRGPRRVGRPGRPVRHPPPGVPARGHARGGARSTRTTCTSCSPTCGRRPSSCRSSRARCSGRHRPTTCSPSWPRRATSARPATAAGTGRARTSRRRRSRCGPPRRRTSSSSTRRPDRPRVLGEVDLFSAQVLVHERAIYIHESVQYYVDRLDWDERKAYVHRIDVDHYTYANRAVTLKPLEVFAEAPATGGRRIHGEVMVASLVTLFKKLKFLTDENVGWGPIDLPELELQTTAYWLTAERRRAARWRRDDLDVALLGRRPGDPDGGGRAADGRPARPRASSPRSARRTPSSRPSTCTRRSPAGSGCRSGCGTATTSCSPAAAELIAACGCDGGCPACTGPRLEPGVDARALALRLLAELGRRRSPARRRPDDESRRRRGATPGPAARALPGRRLRGGAGRRSRRPPVAAPRPDRPRAWPSASPRRSTARSSDGRRASSSAVEPSRATIPLDRAGLATLPGQPPPDVPLVCLDTETTGLATAAGTVAFCIGLGWWMVSSYWFLLSIFPNVYH